MRILKGSVLVETRSAVRSTGAETLDTRRPSSRVMNEVTGRVEAVRDVGAIVPFALTGMLVALFHHPREGRAAGEAHHAHPHDAGETDPARRVASVA